MKPCRITVLRKACYPDLSARYENPLEQPCTVEEGQVFLAVDGQMPQGFCASAWQSLAPFVAELARGGGNFYGGWMKDPYSALVSCNDGVRPVSFLVEALPERGAE
jgi:uncharacterized repeat protein (TIGR04076 family)